MDVFEHDDSEELKPARYDESPSNRFRPRLPMKAIAGALAMLMIAVTAYYSSQNSQSVDLRQSIADIHHNDIQPVAEHIGAFRTKLMETVHTLAAREPRELAKPGLEIERFARRPGIYMRVNEADLGDDEALAEAMESMVPDSLGACLGLSPQATAPLFSTREILTQEWLETTLAEEDVLRLRVAERQLLNQVEHDLPLVLDLVQSDYLLLMVVRGESRMESPVDVYLWDLREDELLAQTRTVQRGRLLNVRIGVGEPPRVRGHELPQRSGVVDCSIASAVRGLTGGAVPETSNVAESAPPSDEDAEEPDEAPEDAEESDEAPEDADEAPASTEDVS